MIYISLTRICWPQNNSSDINKQTQFGHARAIKRQGVAGEWFMSAHQRDARQVSIEQTLLTERAFDLLNVSNNIFYK